MIDRDAPVTDEELHAFIDGELPADRQEAVAAWRAQADAIRARYGAVASEPVPERLKLDQVMRRERAGGRSWAAMAAAAAIVAFVFGGAAGWMARGASACLLYTS